MDKKTVGYECVGPIGRDKPPGSPRQRLSSRLAWLNANNIHQISRQKTNKGPLCHDQDGVLPCIGTPFYVALPLRQADRSLALLEHGRFLSAVEPDWLRPCELWLRDHPASRFSGPPFYRSLPPVISNAGASLRRPPPFIVISSSIRRRPIIPRQMSASPPPNRNPRWSLMMNSENISPSSQSSRITAIPRFIFCFFS